MQKEELLNFRLPRYKELPDMELYMDQLVSYLEKIVGENTITNTMINNYVKLGIVKAPIKKRYKNYHVAYLIAVILLKKVYSLDEIVKLINYQISQYDISSSYDFFCDEFEACLKAIINNEKMPANDVEKESIKLLRATVKSIAYKIYVEANLL